MLQDYFIYSEASMKIAKSNIDIEHIVQFNTYLEIALFQHSISLSTVQYLVCSLHSDVMPCSCHVHFMPQAPSLILSLSAIGSNKERLVRQAPDLPEKQNSSSRGHF